MITVMLFAVSPFVASAMYTEFEELFQRIAPLRSQLAAAISTEAAVPILGDAVILERDAKLSAQAMTESIEQAKRKKQRAQITLALGARPLVARGLREATLTMDNVKLSLSFLQSEDEARRRKIARILCGSGDIRHMVEMLGTKEGAPEFVINKAIHPLYAECYNEDGEILGMIYLCLKTSELKRETAVQVSWKWEP